METDVTITVDENKPNDIEEFESENWPKADEEHYGTAALNLTKYTKYVAARRNNVLLGFSYIQVDAGVMTIKDLLVCYNNQRQGIGGTLLLESEKIALEQGCHVIELITGKDWNARKLYEHLGFELLCELPNYYVHKDFILMIKRLDV